MPHFPNTPLGIVKRDERELQDFVQNEIGFLTSLARLDERPIELEPYQLGFLGSRSRFRWVTKSRQVGYSFILALEALARCHLRPRHTAVFVSYNLDDAREKILSARQVYEELPLEFQKKLITDNKTELAFESNGPRKRLSRIISHPSKAPRGKHGDVALDELAHYVNDREVYKGSTALILRSNGQLTGCSTPLGRRGIFWEIAQQELRPYRHHWRQDVPWWLCSFFCHDVEAAADEAPVLPTPIRVERFGRPTIIEQFDSLPPEDFGQEFECDFHSDVDSYYPYDLIIPCTSDAVTLYDDFADIPKPDGSLVAGFDVGRTTDNSELALFERQGDRLTCRMLRSYDRVPFADQEADLRHLLSTLRLARLSIDGGGIGMHLAENLAREFPHAVVREKFGTLSKERWATEFKISLQRRLVLLPRDRELVAQIHSIRREVTPAGKLRFGSTPGRRGHADRFWAVALACQKERWQIDDEDDDRYDDDTGTVRAYIVGPKSEEERPRGEHYRSYNIGYPWLR